MNDKIEFKRFVLRVSLWALAVLVVILIVYCIPNLFDALTSTYSASYETVKVSDTQKCYLVKDEQIVYAENTGTASYGFGEGTYIRKYSQVCSVGDRGYSTTQPGTLSYTVDGLEAYFIPENIGNITQEAVEEFDYTMQQLGSETVNRGDPLFKVVDNKEWYLIYWVDSKEGGELKDNQEVEVVLDEKTKIQAQIISIYSQGDDFMVVLKSSDYYASLPTQRVVDAEVITVNETGIVLDADSIVNVDGVTGVYVKQVDGDFKFVEVDIITFIGDKRIVRANTFTKNVDGEDPKLVQTIKLYDEILKKGENLSKNYNKGGDKDE